MDQIMTGRLIAQRRKARGLTQRQLADALRISDKTVSKWECGKGFPEVSLMMPLCEALGVTVNDLLSGRRVEKEEYQTTAERNMMTLMAENAENKRLAALSAVCGAISVIAVCSLVMNAAFLPLPTAARIALIALAAVTGAAGVAAASPDARAGYYECPRCKALFAPTMEQYVRGFHTLTRRRLTCPECGKTGMCRTPPYAAGVGLACAASFSAPVG